MPKTDRNGKPSKSSSYVTLHGWSSDDDDNDKDLILCILAPIRQFNFINIPYTILSHLCMTNSNRDLLTESAVTDLPFFRWWKNTTDSVNTSVFTHWLDVADRLLELLSARTVRPSNSDFCTDERRWSTGWRYHKECSCNWFAVIWIQHNTSVTLFE